MCLLIRTTKAGENNKLVGTTKAGQNNKTSSTAKTCQNSKTLESEQLVAQFIHMYALFKTRLKNLELMH